MNAGQLRDRISFRSPAFADDGQGGSSVVWTPEFTVWGAFMPKRGREQLEAGRLESSVEGVVKVRSSSQTKTIKPEWICVIDGIDHNIRSITNPDRRSRFLEMVVERGVAT